MNRGRALAVLVLVVGGLVVLSLSTVVAGTEKAPARYAQLDSRGHVLDVWRDTSTGQLTFHWDADNASEATRYVPKSSTLAELSGGRVLNVSRYPSSAAAWSRIHLIFGVSRRQVAAALLSGSPSGAPPTAGVKVTS